MVSGPGLKDEENGGQKSLWNVPINRIQKSHMTPRSLILWGNWLFAVWYCGEIDSGQYDTVERLTQCSMILWGDWLSSVSYPGEIWITRQKLNKFFFLYHWSVAKAGSNDKKIWRSKISLDCPFNALSLSKKYTTLYLLSWFCNPVILFYCTCFPSTLSVNPFS